MAAQPARSELTWLTLTSNRGRSQGSDLQQATHPMLQTGDGIQRPVAVSTNHARRCRRGAPIVHRGESCMDSLPISPSRKVR
jgi:hypothetical protein